MPKYLTNLSAKLSPKKFFNQFIICVSHLKFKSLTASTAPLIIALPSSYLSLLSNL